VKNVTGVAGNAVGVVAVPEKPKVDPKDSLKAGQPGDSVGRKQPPAKPPRAASDTLKKKR
jgi:hypothetical protein